MSAPLRRGACPALAAPMQTGDGLLIRLSPVSGGLSPSPLIGLCESASRHGNGTVEVTARGSLQFRGFTEPSAARFAAEVDALGIAVRTGVPVETGPLAGMDPAETADPSPLAEALRQAIATVGLAAKLGPKVSVVIDGGGSIPMDAIAADVRLTAEHCGANLLWQVAIAGDAASVSPLGSYDATEVVSVVMSILVDIAALGLAARGRDLVSTSSPNSPSPSPSPSRASPSTPLPPPEGEDWRRAKGLSRELDICKSGQATVAPGNISFSGPLLVGDEVRSDSRRPSSPSGGGRGVEGEARDGGGEAGSERGDPDGARWLDATEPGRAIPLNATLVALPLALPFGSVDAKTLIALAEAASAHGVRDIRPAPNRTLLPICPSAGAAEALRTAAARLGFITDPGDPRARIAACPGAPACASGLIPARTIAGDLAALLGQPANAGMSLHVSGCAKGCARQAPAGITIVGDEKGVALVANGTARHRPVAYSTIDGLPAAVARLLAAGGPRAAARRTGLEREAR